MEVLSLGGIRIRGASEIDVVDALSYPVNVLIGGGEEVLIDGLVAGT